VRGYSVTINSAIYIERFDYMLILFTALIFGIVVLLILLKNMKGDFRAQLSGQGSQKIRAVIKLILLIEVVIYILIFLVVIIKTIFM